jgi:hypothetical protein
MGGLEKEKRVRGQSKATRTARRKRERKTK